jgi:hypothetical protein
VGTLATYTPDIVHDVVGDPLGTLREQPAIGERYAHLFSNVKGEAFAVKHRLYGDSFVVDDKIWTARVEWEVPGNCRSRSANSCAGAARLRIPRRSDLQRKRLAGRSLGDRPSDW